MRSKKTKKLCVTLFTTLLLTSCSEPQDVLRVRNDNLDLDIAGLYCKGDIPTHPLTLDEIICVTLDRNLDLLVKEWEYAVQFEAVTHEKLKMIPNLTYNSEFSYRNKNTGSSSVSLDPLVPPAPPSISSEQHVSRWDFTLAWNLIDFGLSYYRSKQETNRALMKCLEYERLRQNLVADVVRNFWKAVAAKRAIDGSQGVIGRSVNQRGILEREMDQRIITKIQGLRNINQLLNIQIQLQAYEREYHLAISELSQRMGLPPCSSITIANVNSFPVCVEPCNICELEYTALRNRPELYSADAEEMIWVNEVYAEILQMMPGIQLFSGEFHNKDKFLIHHNWWQAGLRTAWNLLSIPQHWVASDIAVKREDLVRANRMALSVAVVTQVRLAYLVYYDNREQYELARQLAEVNKKMLVAAREESAQGKLNEADILRYEAEALFSDINALKAYADMSDSLEKLNNALGLPLYFRNYETYGPPLEPDLINAPRPKKPEPIQKDLKKEEKKEEVRYYEPSKEPASTTGSASSSRVTTPSSSDTKVSAPDFSDVPPSFREDFPDFRKVDNPFDKTGPYSPPPPNVNSANETRNNDHLAEVNTKSSSNIDDDDHFQKELDALLND